MAVLSEKDRRDAFPEVLEGHYQEASVYREFNPDEIYIPYVWNPRVENEVLTRWRKKILGYFDKGQRDAFEADPKSIWTWIEENISVRNDKERLTAYTTPGAWNCRREIPQGAFRGNRQNPGNPGTSESC